MLSPAEKIKLFISLFKSRSDVFARRWESKDGKATGYFPATEFNNKQKYLPLSEWFLEKHLTGSVVIGIYPLLTDNNSNLVAADFDGENWLEACRKVLLKSQEFGIKAYVERSRSGQGGHVWWFLENPYPAYKSRKVFLHLIKDAGGIDEFDKEDSFDRLFPSQDFLSRKGFGNLIALPLQGEARKLGNTVFLDPENNFEPDPDQWAFLTRVEKVSCKTLDELFGQLTATRDKPSEKIPSKGIPITLGNYISIPKNHIFRALVNFLAENLNFLNSEYIVKQKMGLSTYRIEKYFRSIIKDDSRVLIPRGFLQPLLDYFHSNDVSFTLHDERQKLPEIEYKTHFELLDYQSEALESFEGQEQGLLIAPPGSGKTIMGLALVASKKQPALIIVHRKQIYNQWLERIEHFLKIPKRKIGQLAGIKKSALSPITVAMVQTLARQEDLKDLSKQFGLVLVDECHHMPARMFREVVPQLNPYYLFGLTATPQRKNNDEKLIYIYLGDTVHEISGNYQSATVSNLKQWEIKIRDTDFALPFQVANADFAMLSKFLIFDTQRNKLITEDIAAEARSGQKCLVLTERKEHVEALAYYLKSDFEIIVFTGDLTEKQKQEKIKQIRDRNFQILIATGQLIGEGTSFPNLTRLFLVYPFAFEGKLIQYMGRLRHGEEGVKVIYDYHDGRVDYLEKLFKKRLRFYKKI